MSTLSGDNSRVVRPNSVEHLITEGLGYCCEYFFWSAYADKPATLIAARLGVEPDTVRRHRLWLREGRFTCRCLESCLIERLEMLK